MSPSAAITVAVIAGVVSLGVSLLTSYLSVRSLRHKLKLEIAEKYREKLHDLRLEHYPTAFEITGRMIFDPKSRSSPGDLLEIKKDLRSWRVGPAAALLSRESAIAYYKLEKVLKRMAFEEGSLAEDGDDGSTPGGYESSQEDINRLFNANKFFRAKLKEDLHILFSEVDLE